MEIEQRLAGLEQDLDVIKASLDPTKLISKIVDMVTMDNDEQLLENLKVVGRTVHPGLESKFQKIQGAIDDLKQQHQTKLESLHIKMNELENLADNNRQKCAENTWLSQVHSESLEMKADKNDLNKLERMLGHYAPIHEFRDLQKLMIEEYTRNDEFEIAQKRIIELKEELLKKADTSILNSEIRSIHTEIQRRISKYTEITTFDEQMKTVQAEINKITSNVSHAADDLNTMKSISDLISRKLKNKIEFQDLRNETKPIWDNFNKFCSYKHIKDIQTKIDPFIEDVTEKVEGFETNNRSMKKIIQRFDEVLLEKASKFSVEELQTELNNYVKVQYFDGYKADITKYQAVTAESIAETKVYMDNVKDDLYSEFQVLIDKCFEDVKKKLFETIGGRPINSKELNELLESKADKKETNFLCKTKASKDVTFSNSKAIEKLRDQLDHAVVLIIECIKNNIAWNGETKHSLVNKNASALHQLTAIYKWIHGEYMTETSITDQIDNICRYTRDTNNTILPVTANKLFARRKASQQMPSQRHSTSLDINISDKNTSRNKFVQSILTKPKTTLMAFNFNDGLDKFKSIPFKQSKKTSTSLASTHRVHSKSRSPSEANKTQSDMSKVILKADLPKLDISLINRHKTKMLTSKAKFKQSAKRKFKEFIDKKI